MNIRPYESRDRDDVHFVCLNSEGPCKNSKRYINFALAVYCDYYIEKEPENCFVATDEDDKVIGYIICAENFDDFYNYFQKEYCSRISKWEFRRKKSAFRSIVSHRKYKDKYPAHIHIDILPDFQRMGLGRALTDVLLEHLRRKGIKGLMLTTWIKNTKGRRFYDKYGFVLLEETKNCAVYAMTL